MCQMTPFHNNWGRWHWPLSLGGKRENIYQADEWYSWFSQRTAKRTEEREKSKYFSQCSTELLQVAGIGLGENKWLASCWPTWVTSGVNPCCPTQMLPGCNWLLAPTEQNEAMPEQLVPHSHGGSCLGRQLVTTNWEAPTLHEMQVTQVQNDSYDISVNSLDSEAHEYLKKSF